MRKYRHALTFTVLGLPLMAVAQVPVVDYEQGAASGGSGYSTAAPSGDGAYAGGGAAAPSSAQGMLFMQLQQMQRMGGLGALAGMIVGAVMVILWKNVWGDTGIYEIIPGFVCSFIAIIVVSLLGKAPSSSITERFDEADRLYKQQTQ